MTMQNLGPGEILISRGSGTGARQYTIGRVTRDTWSPHQYPEFTAPEQRELQNGQRSGLVVPIETDQEHWATDGLSFGVGAERGWAYSARCRAATDEEVAAAYAQGRAATAEREQQRAAKARHDDLYRRVHNAFSWSTHVLPDSNRE